MLLNDNRNKKTVSVLDWKEYTQHNAGVHPAVENAMLQEAINRGQNPLRYGEASFFCPELLEVGDVIEHGGRDWQVNSANWPRYKATMFVTA